MATKNNPETTFLPVDDQETALNSLSSPAVTEGRAWKNYQKYTFRVAAVYLLILCLPIDPEIYKYISKIDWSELNCRDMFIISTFRHPEFMKINTESGKWGIASYINLFIPLVIALAAAPVWGWIDRKRKNYDTLYYWVRTIARYRVGIGLVAWGYRKLVPGQMVLPTIGILNTPFGDFQAQKLYWQSVGIVPEYEVFLGFAEWIAGFLLLFRKTSALGAALTAVILGNIVIANHVYDGSVHVHSACYSILALIILWYDLPKVFNLLVLEKDVTPVHYYPSFSAGWKKYFRTGSKIAIHAVFVAFFFFLQLEDYRQAPYRLPDTPGIAGTKGTYQVTRFIYDGKELPYDPASSVRWQDVILESWSTLSFKVNKAAVMDQSNGGGYSKKDLERSWELAGIGGGRRYFYYREDPENRKILLQNKNEKHRDEKFSFRYHRITENKLTLEGTDENKHTFYIELERSDKTYPVLEGRRQAVVSLP